MRNRVDKIGVASPEIREQQPDQIVIQLAGIHDPEQAAKIIGKTAELELFDLTPALISPSVTARLDSAVPYRNLYNLLSLVQSKATGTPSGYVLFKPVKVTTGTGKSKKTKTVYVIASARASATDSGAFPTLHRDASTGNAGLLDAHGGKVPAGWKVLKV